MSKSKLGALGGNEAGHIIAAGVMAGVAVLGPVVLDIDEIDEVSFDIQWTGTPTGVLLFEVSNSYLPNRKDMSGTPVRAGKWVSVTARLAPAIVQPAGGPSNIFVGFPHTDIVMAATYLRVTYTNASGVGVLDVYASGKAIG